MKMQAVFNGDLPEHYFDSFRLLKKYIEESLDLYKDELQSVLFPIFVELFLGMV
jgi:transcription initiation factor TFIID subunit 5